MHDPVLFRSVGSAPRKQYANAKNFPADPHVPNEQDYRLQC